MDCADAAAFYALNDVIFGNGVYEAVRGGGGGRFERRKDDDDRRLTLEDVHDGDYGNDYREGRLLNDHDDYLYEYYYDDNELDAENLDAAASELVASPAKSPPAAADEAKEVKDVSELEDDSGRWKPALVNLGQEAKMLGEFIPVGG